MTNNNEWHRCETKLHSYVSDENHRIIACSLALAYSTSRTNFRISTRLFLLLARLRKVFMEQQSILLEILEKRVMPLESAARRHSSFLILCGFHNSHSVLIFQESPKKDGCTVLKKKKTISYILATLYCK